MTLDKSSFANTDMQNSPTSTTQETFLLAGPADRPAHPKDLP